MDKKMVFPYALIKFPAACSLFFSFLLFFFIGSDMNFFKTSEYLTGFSSEFNKYEPLSELSDDTYELSPSKTGTYYIVVTGYGIEGKIKTNWKIK
ncbi:hypothetical protein EKA14_15160 [Bacillus mycoides]|uniref:hypothetical protein n=1 Tax=Bacillus hominis TaxID=2817478 RepID=UPI000FE3669C|nr:hypothetical protein [Bacillus hominis]RWS42597.1 hypothetical protein EKA14_15160 [Bacillus mycoides]